MEIIIQSIITMIIILSIAAIGGSLSERAGIINLSIEGFMTIGAISYSMIACRGSLVGNEANQFWMMPLAAVMTTLMAAIYGLVTIKFKANQTIAGIALNSLALALSIFLINSSANPIESAPTLKIQDGLWNLGETSDSVGYIFNIVVMMGIPVISMVIIMLNTTKFGKKIKAVGENPHAAASLGIRVEWVQFSAVILAGLVSGLAGAFYAQYSGSYFSGSTQGVGFLAVAIVVFGQWRPTYILGGAIVFGTSYGLVKQAGMPQLQLDKHVPMAILEMIPYMLSLMVLIFTSKNAKAPKALGIPYVNAGR